MAKRIAWTEQAKVDVRGIERPIAWQILKTLARYAQTGEGNIRGQSTAVKSSSRSNFSSSRE